MRVFEFTRGDFSCHITLSNQEVMTFHSIKYPASATTEVREKFLEEAEAAVLSKLDKETEETDSTKRYMEMYGYES